MRRKFGGEVERVEDLRLGWKNYVAGDLLGSIPSTVVQILMTCYEA